MGWLTKMRRVFWGRNRGAVVMGADGNKLSTPTGTEVKHVVVYDGNGTWHGTAALTGSTSLLGKLEAAAKSYACMVANSTAAASLPWVPQVGGAGKWVAEPQHELSSLIANPMGVPAAVRPRIDWQQWLELMCLHIHLEGDGYNEVGRGTAKNAEGIFRPIALNPLLPDRVEAVSTDNRTVDIYTYGTHEIAPLDMLHIWNTNPSSLLVGQAPTDAAQHAINIESTAQQRTDAELTNKIQPGIMVVFAKGIKKDQADALIADLNARFLENEDTGKPVVMGGGPEIKSFPATVIDFEKVRNLATSDIVAVYGTPPSAIGDMSAATLQNFSQSTRIWWTNKLFPLLQLIAGSLNTQIIQPYYGPDVRLWYDIAGTEVGLIMFDAAVDVAQKLVNMGYPPNIAAEHVGLGLPHVPALDAPLQQLALAGRTDTDDDTNDEEPA